MAENLLAGIKKSDINKFKKDFFEVLRVAAGIDKQYVKGIEVDDYVKEYKQLIKSFNQKYSLQAKIDKTMESITLKIFFPEKNIKTFVSEVAIRIPGLVSLGIKSFNEVPAAEMGALLNKITKKVCLGYYTPESGTDNICFELSSGIEIYYDASILEEQKPTFQLCAYYALKDGFKDIDIHILAASFGFVEMLTPKEERERLNKFNPYFGE